MAPDWSSTEPWMATLCDSSVCLFHSCHWPSEQGDSLETRTSIMNPNCLSSRSVSLLALSMSMKLHFVIHGISHFTSLFFPSVDSPEPHILLFRRSLGTDPQTGRVDPELERVAREEYKGQFGILRK